MNGRAGQFAFAGMIGLAAFFSEPAQATITPFLPPAPVEGEQRAYVEVIETLSVSNDPQRMLRNLDLARERTAGPTRLRAYIDCMRVGPLTNDNAMDLALAAASQCLASFPDHPFPRLIHGMVQVHSFDSQDMLLSGTDELISVFSDYPNLHQAIPYSELASAVRGLTAAGQRERKTDLIKAYFSPLYVPPPSPASDDALLSGIGELLDNEEVALAARLAGFLQKQDYIQGLLAFIPAKQIWPALEARNAQGYEASKLIWAALEKTMPDFGPQKIALLSSLGRLDEIESESLAGIEKWDGEESIRPIVDTVSAATRSLWDAGRNEQSVALGNALVEKADGNANRDISNLAFNTGFRMIQLGQGEEGRALIQHFIATVEEEPDAIEWQSGNAFLDALRVCVTTGDRADRAMARLDESEGDVYTQKRVAYECKRDETGMALLIADRLRNGSMVDRLNLAISLSPTLGNSPEPLVSTARSAVNVEPLKSTISELFKRDPAVQ